MKLIKAVKVDVTGMSTYQETKVMYASELVLAFYQSPMFRIKLFGTAIEELRGESNSSVSKRLSKEDLYHLFMSGEEEWNSDPDYEIDLNVVRYSKRWSNVIGFIIPMKPNINVNAKFFDSSTVEEVADNLAHEWGHTLGIRHSGKYFRESITYLINRWFKLWLKTHTPMPRSLNSYKKVCKRTWYTLWLKTKCYKVLIPSVEE